MGAFDETLVTGAEGARSAVFERPVKLVGLADAPAAATTSKAGLVKKAAATSVVTAANATAAAGDAPTKAEFDAVVALANALKTSVNGIINAQRNADQAEGSKS